MFKFPLLLVYIVTASFFSCNQAKKNQNRQDQELLANKVKCLDGCDHPNLRFYWDPLGEWDSGHPCTGYNMLKVENKSEKDYLVQVWELCSHRSDGQPCDEARDEVYKATVIPGEIAKIACIQDRDNPPIRYHKFEYNALIRIINPAPGEPKVPSIRFNKEEKLIVRQQDAEKRVYGLANSFVTPFKERVFFYKRNKQFAWGAYDFSTLVNENTLKLDLTQVMKRGNHISTLKEGQGEYLPQLQIDFFKKNEAQAFYSIKTNDEAPNNYSLAYALNFCDDTQEMVDGTQFDVLTNWIYEADCTNCLSQFDEVDRVNISMIWESVSGDYCPEVADFSKAGLELLNRVKAFEAKASE